MNLTSQKQAEDLVMITAGASYVEWLIMLS